MLLNDFQDQHPKANHREVNRKVDASSDTYPLSDRAGNLWQKSADDEERSPDHGAQTKPVARRMAFLMMKVASEEIEAGDDQDNFLEGLHKGRLSLSLIDEKLLHEEVF